MDSGNDLKPLVHGGEESKPLMDGGKMIPELQVLSERRSRVVGEEQLWCGLPSGSNVTG